METGCQKGIINCCYCNCLDTMCVTIIEFIISILGTIFNSATFSLLKKAKDKLDSLFTIYYINFSYFGSSSVIIVILFVLRIFHKLEHQFGYAFGSYVTLIYSYISKIIAILNIFMFLYLLGFTSIVTVRTNSDNVKDILPVTNIGLGGVVDLIGGTEGVKLDCDSMDCYDNEKEESLPNIEYIDFFFFYFYSDFFFFIYVF